MRVDSHHHLWHFDADQYDWIAPSMTVLRRDYLCDELAAVARQAGIEATIAVQARQCLEENDALLAAADRCPIIAGVVGWVDLREADVARTLDRYLADPRFRGVRHIVQAEPDGFLADPAFNRGIRALAGTGLVYDLLILGRQLGEAIDFVDRHPAQSFVLDHIAKPTICEGAFDDTWARDFRELARRPHVTCKLSGMVTEVRDEAWTTALLRPYVDVALDAFGPRRLMIGTDWPVCRLRCGYGEWLATLDLLLGDLSPDQQQDLRGATALRVYGLQPQAR